MKRVHIEVTAEDIAAGKRDSAGCCPIAIACRRATGHPAYVSTRHLSLWAVYDTVRTPDVAREFIVDFDEGRAVSPFAFDLELP